MAAKRPGRYRIGAKYFSTGWGLQQRVFVKQTLRVFGLKNGFQDEFPARVEILESQKSKKSDHTTVLSHDIHGYYIRNLPVFQHVPTLHLQLENAKRRFRCNGCIPWYGVSTTNVWWKTSGRAMVQM